MNLPELLWKRTESPLWRVVDEGLVTEKIEPMLLRWEEGVQSKLRDNPYGERIEEALRRKLKQHPDLESNLDHEVYLIMSEIHMCLQEAEDGFKRPKERSKAIEKAAESAKQLADDIKELGLPGGISCYFTEEEFITWMQGLSHEFVMVRTPENIADLVKSRNKLKIPFRSEINVSKLLGRLSDSDFLDQLAPESLVTQIKHKSKAERVYVICRLHYHFKNRYHKPMHETVANLITLLYEDDTDVASVRSALRRK